MAALDANTKHDRTRSRERTMGQWDGTRAGKRSRVTGALSLCGDRDTYLRIHGTPYPRSIGGRASSGCVRMVMAHIKDLYPNVELGSTAYLYSAEDSVTAGS